MVTILGKGPGYVGRKKRGRPQRNFMDVVREDMQ